MSYILKIIVVSIIFVGLLHYSYNYLLDTLTEPKVKDLVNRPKEKYESIMKVVNSPVEQNISETNANQLPNNSVHAPQQDGSPDMKDVLNNYVTQLNHSDSNGGQERTSVEQMAVENMQAEPPPTTSAVGHSDQEGTSISMLPTI